MVFKCKFLSIYCLKSAQIRFFSDPYFPAFRLNTERYSVSLRIQSECGKRRTRKNSLFGHFSRSGFFNPNGTVTHKSKISYLILVHWIVNIWQTHILTEFNKSSSLQMLWKIGFLKNFAETLWKRDSNTGVLLWILRNF